MNNFWNNILFSINIIIPLILLIFAGKWFTQTKQIRTGFINDANHLLFNYGIPGLLFFSILKSDVSILSTWRLVVASYIAILLLYFISLIFGKKHIQNKLDLGIFVQGVFRGNLAIVGLALVSQTYGDYGIAVGALIAGLSALLLNILGVICLEQSTHNHRVPLHHMIIKMIKNPLIISIILAIFIKVIALPIPEFIIKFGDLFTRITLPLALICSGASCNFEGIFQAGKYAIWASIGRLILSPILFVISGMVWGLSGKDLGILFLLGAAPAATTGYVMAKVMGGNHVMAANIVAITTVGCLFIVAPPIALFPLLGWI